MSIPVLTPLLGFRQAQIMQLLWEHGPATARELHTWLTRDARVADMTVHNSCTRLVESGVLKRRRVAVDEAPTRAKQAYVYIPRRTQADLLEQAQLAPASLPDQPEHHGERAFIEPLLAYLGTLPDGHQACVVITALLERAERAERAALVYQAEAVRARHSAASAEHHAPAQPEPPRRRARPVPSAAIYEYPGSERICRVCGRPAPPPPLHRKDALRVCALESCRQEARRRDNVTKQRRCIERKRAQQIAGEA